MDVDQKTLEAIETYITSTGCNKINNALLNVSSTDELKGSIKKTCQLIENFLLEHPVKTPTKVYRGINVKNEKEFSAIKFGGKHIVRTFMSTSSSMESSLNFIDKGGCCMLEIILQEGVYAADLSALFIGEKEMLVLFGGILEYKKKRREEIKGQEIFIYECEYRPNEYVSKESEFKLMSFNIFNNRCKKQSVKSYLNQLADFDIICTQEDTEEDILFSNFVQLARCGVGDEIEKIYYNKFISKQKPEFVTCVKDGHNRSAILIRYKGLLIANIHMEGGRFVDEMLCTRPIEMQERKMKLLNGVLSYSPDIILGDFNSVYGSNEEQFNKFIASQNRYFNKLCELDDEIIVRWNKEPFDLLLSNQYTYAVPINEENIITNARGKTIVDMIWYKSNGKFRLKNTQIFPLVSEDDNYDLSLKCSFSDHNPIFTTISIF